MMEQIVFLQTEANSVELETVHSVPVIQRLMQEVMQEQKNREALQKSKQSKTNPTPRPFAYD